MFPTAPEGYIGVDVASGRKASNQCLFNTEFLPLRQFSLSASWFFFVKCFPSFIQFSVHSMSTLTLTADLDEFSCTPHIASSSKLAWHRHGFKKQMHFEDNRLFFSVPNRCDTFFCSAELNIGNLYTSPLLPSFPSSYSELGLLSDNSPLLLHSLCWGYYQTNLPSSSSSSHPACLYPHHTHRHACMFSLQQLWDDVLLQHAVL